MWISTFHALCARLLRREAPRIGLTRDFVIYDSSDQLAVVKQAFAICRSTTAAAAARRLCPNQPREEHMEGAPGFDEAWNPRGDSSSSCYARYTAPLNASNALDFDDLLLKTVDLFENHASVRARYASGFVS